MTKVTIDEVKQMIERGEDITIVDSRSAEAWEKSDIKAGGALRIPPDEAEKHLADVSRDSYTVVYCT